KAAGRCDGIWVIVSNRVRNCCENRRILLALSRHRNYDDEAEPIPQLPLAAQRIQSVRAALNRKRVARNFSRKAALSMINRRSFLATTATSLAAPLILDAH